MKKTPKKYRLKVIAGSHREDGVTYKTNQVFESDRPWHVLMVKRFALAPAAAPVAPKTPPGAAGGAGGKGSELPPAKPDEPPAGDAGAGEGEGEDDQPEPRVWEKTHRGGGYYDVHDQTGEVHPNGGKLKKGPADDLIEQLNSA